MSSGGQLWVDSARSLPRQYAGVPLQADPVLLVMSDATTSLGIGRHLIPRQAVVSGNPVDGMVPLLNDLDIDTGRH
jgi:hypothetical protein